MLQISITGPEPSQRIQKTLEEAKVVRIGRSPNSGWAIPWDKAISREQADLFLRDGKVFVTCTSMARNPIVYRQRTTKQLSVRPGDWFQIGSTTFQVITLDSSDSHQAVADIAALEFDKEPGHAMEEYSYSEKDLQKFAFRNSGRQMEILSRLPRMITGASSDEDLARLLAQLLLQAIPEAQAIAAAHFDMSQFPTSLDSINRFPKPLTLRVETRQDFQGRFRPSRKMIFQALTQQTSLMHIWGDDESSGTFTVSEGLGWAFCVPVRGESSRGWCLYISGKGSHDGGLVITEDSLASDLRFVELVSQFIGSIRHVRMLQEQKTQLSSFFSPKVIENLTVSNSTELLTPAEKEISVLFCDVRGFSDKSEKLRQDLLKLLRSVSSALGVMARGILDRDGTIADFQGDAALGFWGWPVELGEGPLPACRAALTIYHEFANASDQKGHLLEGFSVGLGLAHGRALAGQIGTDSQSKIGVFGPVVNKGARLESLTKQLGVPICMDETTAEYAKSGLDPSDGRIRALVRIRPQGMQSPITVFGLEPSSEHLTEQVMSDYQAGLNAVTDGYWEEAIVLLNKINAVDGPRQFLLKQMSRYDNKPPNDWDGAFQLVSK